MELEKFFYKKLRYEIKLNESWSLFKTQKEEESCLTSKPFCFPKDKVFTAVLKLAALTSLKKCGS